MTKITGNSRTKESKAVKIIIKILLIMGALGLIGFMIAFVSMLTHYNLFKS